MAEIYQTINRQPEYIEKRTEQLLASVYGDPNATRNQGESEEDFNLRKFGRAFISKSFYGSIPTKCNARGFKRI